MSDKHIDALKLAREAGLFVHKEVQPELERFAALVAAAAKVDERVACAQVCDGLWQDDGTAYDCREAILARGKT